MIVDATFSAPAVRGRRVVNPDPPFSIDNACPQCGVRNLVLRGDTFLCGNCGNLLSEPTKPIMAGGMNVSDKPGSNIRSTKPTAMTRWPCKVCRYECCLDRGGVYRCAQCGSEHDIKNGQLIAKAVERGDGDDRLFEYTLQSEERAKDRARSAAKEPEPEFAGSAPAIEKVPTIQEQRQRGRNRSKSRED